MAYRLFYWAVQGRGEQVRLLLNELRQEYEDIHVVKDGDFTKMKREGPGTLSFGSVPMLQDGDFTLVQGPVIMNYLGRKHGIMPNPRAALKQATADSCINGKIPVAIVKDNRKKPFVVMRYADWLEVVKEWISDDA